MVKVLMYYKKTFACRQQYLLQAFVQQTTHAVRRMKHDKTTVVSFIGWPVLYLFNKRLKKN